MKKIIRKILREQFEYKQQLFDLLRTGDSDNIEMVKILSQGQGINILELLIEYFKENPKPPYFKLLNHFDLSEDELINVFSGIFGKPVTINKMSYAFIIYDENGRNMYYENSDGHWYRKEYDENNNQIYFENSYGFLRKYEYDNRGNRIYYEDSTGYIEDYR